VATAKLRGLDGEDLLRQAIEAQQARAAGYARYRQDPVGFARDYLGTSPWSIQRDVLTALAQPRARVSVRSCNGAGKTWLAGSGAALWFLYAFSPCRVVTTSPKRDQLRNSLWTELRRAHALSGLPGECDVLQLRLSDDQFAIGQTANSATAFQGIHAPHVLVIAEEAAGIEEPIWEGIDALLTSEDTRLLIIGNPTSTSGRFFETHHSLRGQYATFHIGAEHTPNFTGEEVSELLRRSLITPAWVEQQREAWGEDSPLYQARIMGNFPDQAEGSLIALSWVEVLKDHEPEPSGAVELGADIARDGGCENAVYVRQGPRILHREFWQQSKSESARALLMETTGRILKIGKDYAATVHRIDATGMGAGVADRLAELKAPGLERVMAGGGAKDTEHFARIGDELAWNLRELIREGRIGPLSDARTQAQLTSRRYKYLSSGRIEVESKDAMRKRGSPSPDRADGLALAFAPQPKHPPAEFFVL
jgi:phage terminase large subunit